MREDIPQDSRPLRNSVVVSFGPRRNIWRGAPKSSARLVLSLQDDECRNCRSANRGKAIVELTKWCVPPAIELYPVASSRLVCTRQLFVSLRLSRRCPLAQHDVEVVEVGCHGAILPGLSSDELSPGLVRASIPDAGVGRVRWHASERVGIPRVRERRRLGILPE